MQVVSASSIFNHTRIALIFLILGLLLMRVSANAQDRPDILTPPKGTYVENQLIVLPKLSTVDIPLEPEEIVSLVARGRSGQLSGKDSQVVSRLGNPKSARFLVTQRRPVEKRRESVRNNDPATTLERYTVLEFETAEAALQARRRLASDSDIEFTSFPSVVQLSAVPADPLFAYSFPGTATNGQWGLSTLQLPLAWDIGRGYAYLGMIDNGILANPQTGVHPDLGANYRPHLSWSFGDCGSNVYCSNVSMDEQGSISVPNSALAAGHGTHVAGIIAATPNNNWGVSGTCWNCALHVGRISTYASTTGNGSFSETSVVDAINSMARWGLQAINMSFGIYVPDHLCPSFAAPKGCAAFTCLSNPNDAYCRVIELATERDVILVAASGNQAVAREQFPASDYRVFSVGGVQLGTTGAIEPWNQLTASQSSPANDNFIITQNNVGAAMEYGTNTGPNMLVVAPARSILSTFYTHALTSYATYNWNRFLQCGANSTFSGEVPSSANPNVNVSVFSGTTTAPGLSANLNSASRFGTCTGTSMAAPFVTGIVGLIRSLNPLRSAAEVKQSLINGASNGGTWNSTNGYGLPNAHLALQHAASTNNGTTPLFALYSSSYEDFLYTVFPQQAASVLNLSLPQTLTSPWIGQQTAPYYSMGYLGTTVSGYPAFPGVNASAGTNPDLYVPRARLRVMTSHERQGVTLWPIYRFSSTTLVPGTVRHFYAVGEWEKSQAVNSGDWLLDGIEGYMYPPTATLPPGAVYVVRRFHPTTWNAVLIPYDDLPFWTSIGYTGVILNDIVGLAFLN